MKRLLSLILALALVIGMIPAVFATENLVEKYMFNTSTGVETFKVGSKVSIPDASSVWEVIAMPGLYSSTAISASETTFSVNTLTPNNNNALVLSLSVNKAGVYEPTFSFNINQIYTGRIDFYLADKDFVLEKGWDLSTPEFLATMISSVKEGNVQYIASQDINKNSTDEDNNWTVPVVLDEGENYLFAIINTPTCGVVHTGGRTFCVIKSLELTYKGNVTTVVGATELNVGSSTTITSTVTDGSGNVCDTEVTYTSSDDDIATVENGTVTAVGEGTATITATAIVNGVKVSDSVKITSKLVKGTITATASKTALKLGETATITAEAKDADGNPSVAELSFKSSDEKVATVDASGKITPVGEGEATITVSAVIDGILVENNDVKVTVSVVWDPVYSFVKSAFTSEVKSVHQITDLSMLKDSPSTGKWQYVSGLKFHDTEPQTKHTNIVANAIQDSDFIFSTGSTTADAYDNALVLKAVVESAGIYKPTVNFKRYAYCGTLDIYFVPKVYAQAKDWNMTDLSGTRAVINDSKLAGTQIGKIHTIDMHTDAGTTTSFMGDDSFYLPAGEHYIVMSIGTGVGTSSHSSQNRYGSIVNITLTRQPTIETTASKTALAVGDLATLTSVVKDNRDNVTADAVTYVSSDRNIVQISGDTITAVGEGTATITATATVDGDTVTDAVEITVEKAKISLAYTTSVDESGDIEVDAYEAGSVTVNAPEKTGYTFSHWVRGTAANGVWVSSDASYKFDLVSPTYLTAIYVEENAKIVEFFNGNGELLAQETVNAEGKVALPKDPSMVGFKFLGWITGKTGDAATPFVNINITNSLRVIADYEVESTTYTVGDESGLKYDAEVTKTADSEDTVWKRNGEPVGYGKTYTYNVWSDTPTPITSEAFTGEKTPLVYLDRTVKAVGIENACMIEFDGAGKEIVEVGILFSSSGTPEVGSCMYKATSKTNGGDDGHGQLTAKPANNTQTVARGYIIYIDNGEYKTEYSDVLSLNN